MLYSFSLVWSGFKEGEGVSTNVYVSALALMASSAKTVGNSLSALHEVSSNDDPGELCNKKVRLETADEMNIEEKRKRLKTEKREKEKNISLHFTSCFNTKMDSIGRWLCDNQS